MDRTVKIMPLSNLEDLMRWRREVIACVFGCEPSAELMLANERYYAEAIENKQHYAIQLVCDNDPAACGSICLQSELPSPDNPSGRNAYLMNIYTRPLFRGRGFGHRVVEYLLQMAREVKCGKIYLETSLMGRKLYEAHGFVPMSGMMQLSGADKP